MPEATFIRDFDYSVPSKGGRVTIAYRAGWSGNIPKAHILAAKRAGAIAEGQPNGDTSRKA